MKKALFLLTYISVILFADYCLIVLIGCFASACGAEESFYCGTFCYLAATVFILSIFLPLYFRFIKQVKPQS